MDIEGCVEVKERVKDDCRGGEGERRHRRTNRCVNEGQLGSGASNDATCLVVVVLQKRSCILVVFGLDGVGDRRGWLMIRG